MDVNKAYSQKQQEKFTEYEARCFRCGACCGIGDADPCTNLIKAGENKYQCRDYVNRIGMHKTASGKDFACIPIRDFLKFNQPYPGCAYSA